MLKKLIKPEDEAEDVFYDDDYEYRDEAELETAKAKLDRAIFEICKTTDEPQEIVSELVSTNPGLIVDVFGDVGEALCDIEDALCDVEDYIEGNSYTDPVSGMTLGFTEWFDYFNVCEEEYFESRFQELYDRCNELYQENCSQRKTIAKLNLDNKRYKQSQEKWEDLRNSVMAEMGCDAEELREAKCMSDRDMLVEIVDSLLREYKAKQDYDERLKELETDIPKWREDARLRKVYEEELMNSVTFPKLREGIIHYAKEYNVDDKELKALVATLSCILDDPLWNEKQKELLKAVAQARKEEKSVVNNFYDQSRNINNSRSISVTHDDNQTLLPQ